MNKVADIVSRRRRRRRRGGSSTEYILVLALVVLPIAALSPMLVGMIVTWSQRIWLIFRLPLG
jgi:hypothetical protein